MLVSERLTLCGVAQPRPVHDVQDGALGGVVQVGQQLRCEQEAPRAEQTGASVGSHRIAVLLTKLPMHRNIVTTRANAIRRECTEET